MIDIREHGGSFGGGGLKATDKQALIDIVNTAESNQTTIKTNIANALNSKVGSSLTSASAWVDIQNAITNATSKKKANGSLTTSASNGSFTINNLTFTPNVIYVKYMQGASNNGQFVAFKDVGITNVTNINNGFTLTTSTNATGFTITNNNAGYENNTVTWVAYE